MILLIECIILCIIFTIFILVPQFKNPISQIASYPPAIQNRVKTLPQYKNILSKTYKKSISRKIIGTFLLTFILSAITYFSGIKTFLEALIHVFILCSAVNLFDFLVLDLCVFPNSKKLRIIGTENEYKNPMHHIKGFFIGILFSIIVYLLSATWIIIVKCIQ